MLINYRISGYKVFNELVELNLKANKQIKNKDFVFEFDSNQILKSAIIYGPNNTGKSTLISSIHDLKEIVLSGKILEFFKYPFHYNFFDEKNYIEYYIEFSEGKCIYQYTLGIKLSKGIKKEILKCNGKLIFDRERKDNDGELNYVINLLENYKDVLLVSMLPKKYKSHTDAIKSFFENMIIANNSFDFNEVINGVADFSQKEYDKYVKILNAADVSIKGLKLYDEQNEEDKKFRLYSEYEMHNKKKSVPSYYFDSDGTQVFMYYMYLIFKLIKTGGILIVDEIDQSLHTLLTKTIINIFNNEDNKNIQLLATSHDLLLLDCKYLFRKDQIWFTYKDSDKVYLYSLNKFKANVDNQIRNNTMESYLKGMFGALPHPNVEDYIFDD